MKSLVSLSLLLVSVVATQAADISTGGSELETLATKPQLTGDDPHWILDPTSQCWVFDGYPSSHETATWSGACKDQLASGEGTVTWYLRGKFVEKRTGSFTLGSLNGHGTATMMDGSTYEGDWVYGARHGTGVLTRANGDIYRGMWPGSGTYTQPDGRTCGAEAIRVRDTVAIKAPCAAGVWASH